MTAPVVDDRHAERRAISVRGLVQGVGFRPYVHSLAARHALRGFVVNDVTGVRIEIEGEPQSLEAFIEALPESAPETSRIESLHWQPMPVDGAERFEIRASATEATRPGPSPRFLADLGTCSDCERELFDPRDRRYLYPFLNCTQCGPRLTIIEGAPYDRERTSMSGFSMCGDCRREYKDPTHRRFHAQPNACPACGPTLRLHGTANEDGPTGDAMTDLVTRLRHGAIAAVKGLGGFHLVCDATSSAAVTRLRQRKRRYEKPFAVMAADVDAARRWAHVSSHEAKLLRSRHRPIVLLEKRHPSIVVEAVAPSNPTIGVLLPYTPLHLVLSRALDGRPLVMTSGNLSDEPIAYEDDDAVDRLGAIADVVLTHDRPIRVRCDDSVVRVVGATSTPIRRSRGFAPEPLRLSVEASKKLLAVGGHLKNTFALGIGPNAFLSHHIGDLSDLRACQAFERDIALYEDLFDFEPEALVHDLHPDYFSTRYATTRANERGVAQIGVQHHHAHFASCLADNAISHGPEALEPAIGVTFDGAGLGTDGTIWGGEFLVGDCRSFTRVGSLRPVPLPGGDAAAREPWRMALSYLHDAGLDAGDATDIPKERAAIVWAMIERGVQSPPSGSAGRLFDAVASLVGLRHVVAYEGQAAMALEWLCEGEADEAPYPFEIAPGASGWVVDTRPLTTAIVEELAGGATPQRVARRFHASLARCIVEMCDGIREERSIHRVALTGGVFQNVLLTRLALRALEAKRFRVLTHHHVPPNDGGLALGQIAVAAAKLSAALEGGV